MDMNNCSLPDSFWIAASWARFARLYVILPVYVVVGLIGHWLFLLAVYKEIKKDSSYRYQLFGVVAGVAEIFAFTFYILSRLCSGVAGGPGYSWFTKNYFLMWCSAHAVIPIQDVCLTTSLLIAISTSADRVFVLTAPAVYRTINKKKHQNVALAICILLGVSINTYRCFLYQLVYKDPRYVMITNADFVESSLSQALELLGNIVKIVCLLALIVFNVIIVVRYRRRFKKVQFASFNDKKEEQRKKAEQTLILLTGSESLFFSLSTCCAVIFCLGVTFVPRFNDCQAFLFGPGQNMVVMLASISDFYAALIISRQFRTMVRKVLPFAKKTKPTTIFVTSKQNTEQNRTLG